MTISSPLSRRYLPRLQGLVKPWVGLLLVLCGCGETPTGPAPQAVPRSRPISTFGSSGSLRAFRWILSELPSADPIVGGQQCGVVWADLHAPFRADVPTLSGELAVWSLREDGWSLVATWPNGAHVREELANGTAALEAMDQPFFIDLAVSSLVRMVPGTGPSSTPAAVLRPLEGATVRVIGGGGGTPTWDSPEYMTDARGEAHIGPLVGSRDIWVDVSAKGHMTTRRHAHPRRAALRSDGPTPVWVPVAVATQGRVRIHGKPPEGPVQLSARVVEVSDAPLHLNVRADGTFEAMEPVALPVRYAAYMPKRDVEGTPPMLGRVERVYPYGEFTIELSER